MSDDQMELGLKIFYVVVVIIGASTTISRHMTVRAKSADANDVLTIGALSISVFLLSGGHIVAWTGLSLFGIGTALSVLLYWRWRFQRYAQLAFNAVFYLVHAIACSFAAAFGPPIL